jgi:hypothetical protein
MNEEVYREIEEAGLLGYVDDGIRRSTRKRKPVRRDNWSWAEKLIVDKWSEYDRQIGRLNMKLEELDKKVESYAHKVFCFEMNVERQIDQRFERLSEKKRQKDLKEFFQ